MTQPIAYSPDIEQPEPDEAETFAGLNAQFDKILAVTSQDYGHAVRSVHAKGHGLVKGRLTIADGLPPELAQGLFASPGSYDAVLRFSTNAGDILDDAIRLPRGVAIKVIGVEGERIEGAGEAGAERGTQDFVMANGPAFPAPAPRKFLQNLKLLAATTDKAEGSKKLLSSLLRGFEKALEAFGGESTTLQALGGAAPVHPLGARYFSQTPFRYGDFVAKFSLVPTGGNAALAETLIDAGGRRDAIREEMNAALAGAGATWALQVQLRTDAEAMPIEDASVVWDEEASPYRTVATLTIGPQAAWRGKESENAEDALSFSPWHGLAAHRPLGGVNRARRGAYAHSADYRARFNGCPLHEPASAADIA